MVWFRSCAGGGHAGGARGHNDARARPACPRPALGRVPRLITKYRSTVMDSTSVYFSNPPDVVSHFNNSNSLMQKTHNGLNFLYMNIVSLRNKLDNLETYVNSLVDRPDIILITETRLFEHEIMYYNIPGYDALFSCRDSNVHKKSGGGVAIFVQQSIKANIISEIANDYDNLLLINLINKNINIAVIYTPPDAPKDTFINSLERILTPVPTLVFGDFNMDLLKLNFKFSKQLHCKL